MTLVGKLADEWPARLRSRKGVKNDSSIWVYYTDVKEKTADLPDVLGNHEFEETLLELPKTILAPSPSGFHATTRTGKPPAMFNGLTSNLSSPSTSAAPSTRRKGHLTFITNEETRQAAPMRAPAHASLPSALGMSRPAVQPPSRPTGAWGAGAPSVKPPVFQRAAQATTTQAPWPGTTTVRIGAPAPQLTSPPGKSKMLRGAGQKLSSADVRGSSGNWRAVV